VTRPITPENVCGYRVERPGSKVCPGRGAKPPPRLLERWSMRYGRRFRTRWRGGTIGLLGCRAPRAGVEYRLQGGQHVRHAYSSFLKSARLGRRLGRGPRSARDEPRPWRRVQGRHPVDRACSRRGRAWLRLRWRTRRPRDAAGGDGSTLCDEIIWDGKPESGAVWLVLTIIRNIQEV